MKTLPFSLFVLAATCAVAPATWAAEPNAADKAATRLAAGGAVPVAAVGPHVEVGTYRVQVSTKLGRPDVIVSADTWLYENRSVQESQARGTLVVRFDTAGRVTQLSLVTREAALALRDSRNAAGTLVSNP